MDNKEHLKSLMINPGAGKSIAQVLLNIGNRQVEELKDRNPQELYEKSNEYA